MLLRVPLSEKEFADAYNTVTEQFINIPEKIKALEKKRGISRQSSVARLISQQTDRLLRYVDLVFDHLKKWQLPESKIRMEQLTINYQTTVSTFNTQLIRKLNVLPKEFSRKVHLALKHFKVDFQIVTTIEDTIDVSSAREVVSKPTRPQRIKNPLYLIVKRLKLQLKSYPISFHTNQEENYFSIDLPLPTDPSVMIGDTPQVLRQHSFHIYEMKESNDSLNDVYYQYHVSVASKDNLNQLTNVIPYSIQSYDPEYRFNNLKPGPFLDFLTEAGKSFNQYLHIAKYLRIQTLFQEIYEREASLGTYMTNEDDQFNMNMGGFLAMFNGLMGMLIELQDLQVNEVFVNERKWVISDELVRYQTIQEMQRASQESLQKLNLALEIRAMIKENHDKKVTPVSPQLEDGQKVILTAKPLYEARVYDAQLNTIDVSVFQNGIFSHNFKRPGASNGLLK